MGLGVVSADAKVVEVVDEAFGLVEIGCGGCGGAKGTIVDLGVVIGYVAHGVCIGGCVVNLDGACWAKGSVIGWGADVGEAVVVVGSEAMEGIVGIGCGWGGDEAIEGVVGVALAAAIGIEGGLVVGGFVEGVVGIGLGVVGEELVESVVGEGVVIVGGDVAFGVVGDGFCIVGVGCCEAAGGWVVCVDVGVVLDVGFLGDEVFGVVVGVGFPVGCDGVDAAVYIGVGCVGVGRL